MDRLDYIKHIFGTSILLTRKWEVIVNRAYPNDDLTLKQMMMLIVIGHYFDEDPTIKQVSTRLVTSHQNVKAILTQLEKKEFVKVYRDPHDKRIQRIQVTEGKHKYWRERNKTDVAILEMLFTDINLDELETTLKVLEKLDKIAGKKLEF